MKEIRGLWWPDDVGDKWQHALRYVPSADVGMRRCAQRRTAVQAGGNVGLWPRRLAASFARVFTFEPDDTSRECLERNVPANVIVSAKALGREARICGLKHKSLGSHRVREDGTGIEVMPLDALELTDVDLLQLDIEGYELHALQGAAETIAHCHPIIQLELRGFTAHFGETDEAIRAWLLMRGYREIATAPGCDVIFGWQV